MLENADWVRYDEGFRRHRAYIPERADHPWDVVALDLWNQATKFPRKTFTVVSKEDGKKPSTSSSSIKNFRASGTSIPTGYCFAFHKANTRCENSKYSYLHKCPAKNCGKSHPLFKHPSTNAPVAK